MSQAKLEALNIREISPLTPLHSPPRPTMLKVIGASHQQTKTTSYILLLFTISGLLILIFCGWVPPFEEDGNYSASVFWEQDSGYKIEFWGQGNSLQDLARGTARGYCRQDIPQTGWGKIEIETNGEYPDEIQAYSAGLLEGSLTWQIVYNRWQNTIEAVCENFPNECENIREELSEWGENIRRIARKQSSLDPFWHQISLFFEQLDGFIAGWHYSIRRTRSKGMEISNEDFLWLQFILTDQPLPDLNTFLPLSSSITSAIIKLTSNNSSTSGDSVLVGQSTAGPYRDMLRMVKRYNFSYRMTRSSTEIPGKILTFTGYPGALTSQDDMYEVQGGPTNRKFIVLGSSQAVGSLGNRRKTIRKRRAIDEKVPGSLRAITATRLALNSRQWVSYFSRAKYFPSAPKLWSILHLNGQETSLLLVQQTGGAITTLNMTQELREKSYWSNEEILGNGERNKHFDCKNGCEKAESLEEVFKGAQTSKKDYGARGDLKKMPEAFGNFDMKIITASKTSKWRITAGPVYTPNLSHLSVPPVGALPPFQWSTSHHHLVPHFGQPDIWEFRPLCPEWIY